MSAAHQLPTLHPAFDPMRRYPQWMVYRLHSPEGGKYQKQPIDHRTGKTPRKGQGGIEICTTFDIASARAAQFGVGFGLGFYFTEADPFWFLDIDNCAVLDESGAHVGWSPLANNLCAMFSGAAVEVSSSSRALHIIATGVVPEGHKCKNTALGIEFYSRDRWVALTGYGARGDAGADCTAAVAALVAQYFSPGNVGTPKAEWTDTPLWHVPGGDDDAKLIERMRTSRSSGESATIEQLWTADADALSKHYPPQKPNEAYDPSGADQALANHVVWWTGGDCERAKRIMQQSALNRGKWEREDYIHDTILKGIEVAAKNPPKSSIPDAASVGFGKGPKPAGMSLVPLAPRAQVVCANVPHPGAVVFTDLVDILNRRSKTEWLPGLKDILEREVLAIMAAQRNMLKSFIALEWAMRAAMAGCGVVILSGEGKGLDRRLDAWLRHHAPGKTAADLSLKVKALERPIALNEASRLQAAAQAIAALPWPVDLLVVDTYSKFTPGLEEQDNTANAEFLSALSEVIRYQFGSSVLLVDHAGHNEPGRPRGASVKMANPDAEYMVDRPDPVGFHVSVTRERFKDSPSLDPLHYVGVVVDLERNEDDGRPITSLAFDLSKAPAAASARKAGRPKKMTGNKRIAWDGLKAAWALHPNKVGAPECVPANLAALEEEAALDAILPKFKVGPKQRRDAQRALDALIGDGYVERRDGWLWATLKCE